MLLRFFILVFGCSLLTPGNISTPCHLTQVGVVIFEELVRFSFTVKVSCLQVFGGIWGPFTSASAVTLPLSRLM